MSRVVSRRLFWEDVSGDVADFQEYAIYAGEATAVGFVEAVDAGSVQPLAVSTTPELILNANTGLPEGSYQFAVCTVDSSGNFSDPFQASNWTNVPLDLVAPRAPISGGIQVLPSGT